MDISDRDRPLGINSKDTDRPTQPDLLLSDYYKWKIVGPRYSCAAIDWGKLLL